MKHDRKISGYWINPDFQGKFLILFGGFILLQASIFFYSLGLIFSEVTELIRVESLSKGAMIDQMGQMQTKVFMLYGSVFTVLTLIFIVVGFRFTHQAAGALFHFKKTFDEIEASGELKELALRDEDFFHDVQASFNKMIKKIKK